jgi:hypothetical protein
MCNVAEITLEFVQGFSPAEYERIKEELKKKVVEKPKH